MSCIKKNVQFSNTSRCNASKCNTLRENACRLKHPNFSISPSNKCSLCCPSSTFSGDFSSDLIIGENIQAQVCLNSTFIGQTVLVNFIAIVDIGNDMFQQVNGTVSVVVNSEGCIIVDLPEGTESVALFVTLNLNCSNYVFPIFLSTNENIQRSINIPRGVSRNKSNVRASRAIDVNTPEFDPSVELLQPDLDERLTIENCCRFAVNTSGFDHANAKEQLGPCRASRAMAIVHIAMFEVYIALKGGYNSYLALKEITPPVPQSNTNLRVAISQAMCDTLTSLFPSQTERIAEQLAFELNQIPNGVGKTNGIAFGSAIASAVLSLRSNDGANNSPVFPETSYNTYISENPAGSTPGLWTKDPISNINVALGYKWSLVTPFVMESSDQFRCPPFPDLTSSEYEAAFNEVKAIGGDGDTTFTLRSEEHTNVGIYWAYDGVPNLCAPPRMYNQIAMMLAIRDGMETKEMLRMLALLNVAMADAGIAAWDSKYFYKVWRPVTGVRKKHFDGTSAPDGNANTIIDTTFTPLGAPATNSSGVDFTPPFPAYPSGHATFGGSLFQMLRNIYGSNGVPFDNVPFTFTSDELNGVTVDSGGNPRDLLPRSFTSFSQAEEENGKSRIYLGIHWTQDANAGKVMGNSIANLVFDTIYTPIV